jgi:signal transduction histidine kinase
MDDFIHNASHELKTPLSVISSNLQLINKLKTYEEDLIKNSIDEIKVVDNLIIGLTNLSSISSIEETESLDIKEEVKNILEEFNNIIKEKNINIFFEVEKNFSIKANKHYFYIMFSNLLRNAIKYNNQKD